MPDFFKKHRKVIIFLWLIFLFILFFVFVLPQKQQNSRITTNTTPKGWQDYDTRVKNGKIRPARKILEVNITYDQTANPELAIGQITQKNGYEAKALTQNDSHKLQVINAQGNVLSEQPFSPPLEERIETFNDDSTIDGQTTTLTKTTFTQTVLWQKEATAVQIVTTSGQFIATKSLSDMQIINNKPTFDSLDGDSLFTPRPTQEEQTFWFQAPKVNAQTNNNKLDIVFVSAKYTDFKEFETEINRISTGLLKYEPLKSRASQITFHAVKNTTPIGCSVDTEKVLSCDPTLVKKRVSQAAVPNDLIVVLYNDDNNTLRGTGGSIVSLHRSDRAPNSIAHEFGHAIGRLLDEYVSKSGPSDIDNKVRFFAKTGLTRYPPGDGNCYAGNPPAAEWEALQPPVPTESYKKGCNYENWYASTPESVMNTTDENVSCFNAVSQGVINRRIDQLVGPNPGGPVPIVPCNPITDPSATVSASPSPSRILPTYTCLSSAPCNPTATPTLGPSPSVMPTEPCGTSGLLQPENNTETYPDQGMRKGIHRGDNGFLRDFFQLMVIMLDLLLKASGSNTGIPCQPAATPLTSPAPSAVPSQGLQR